jgi:hypothetical protein
MPINRTGLPHAAASGRPTERASTSQAPASQPPLDPLPIPRLQQLGAAQAQRLQAGVADHPAHFQQRRRVQAEFAQAQRQQDREKLLHGQLSFRFDVINCKTYYIIFLRNRHIFSVKGTLSTGTSYSSAKCSRASRE